MNNNLSLIPFLIQLGKKTVQTIQINTVLAVSVKAVFLLLPIFGMSNLSLAILADVGITILVSLRLFNFKERAFQD